jgi:hypothetical protein
VADREDIAKRHGFASFAELLDASEPLPMLPGDVMRCYVARQPNGGHWFIWEDVPRKPLNESKDRG